jgi:hypothetical protein
MRLQLTAKTDLPRIALAVRMQHVFPSHPALEREQSQNQQRQRTDPQIAQCGESQRTQNQVRNQCHGQANHNPCQIPRKKRSGFRRRTQPFTALRVTPAKAAQYWCTGKDSNLRTSLGGTDLQSVGFNHSPTCAKTVGRCSRRFGPAGRGNPLASFRRQPDFRKTKFSRTGFRKSGKPRIALTDYRAKITTRRIKFRMECVGKTCCAATY